MKSAKIHSIFLAQPVLRYGLSINEKVGNDGGNILVIGNFFNGHDTVTGGLSGECLLKALGPSPIRMPAAVLSPSIRNRLAGANLAGFFSHPDKRRTAKSRIYSSFFIYKLDLSCILTYKLSYYKERIQLYLSVLVAAVS